MSADHHTPQVHTPDGSAWRLISEALHELRFGLVTRTDHHGRIVQIERSEKLRLHKPGMVVSKVPPKKKDISVDRVSGNLHPSGNPDHA